MYINAKPQTPNPKPSPKQDPLSSRKASEARARAAKRGQIQAPGHSRLPEFPRYKVRTVMQGF